MTEIVDVIDDKENVIRQAEKEEVITKRLLHKGALVLVLNSKGELLVHKRTLTKRLYPGTYAMFVGGGAITGETFEEAAKRETTEEIGVENPQLTFLFKMRYTSDVDDTMAAVYKMKWDGQIKLQVEEIENAEFVPLAKLKQMMKKEKFCPDDALYFKEIEKRKLL